MKRNTWIVLVLLFASLTLSGCVTQTTHEKRKTEDPSKIADLNTQIGITYMRDGDNEFAKKKFEKTIKADPSHAPAYSALGLLDNRVGDFDEADKNFSKALRLDPASSSILNNYGQVLCQHGQYEKGQKMFLKANENALYATLEIALNNAGTCAMAAGDIESAETHFRAALQKNPRVASSLLQMCIISYDKDRHLPALGYLQRYLEVGTHTPQSLWLGIRIERVLGDKDALASYALQLEKGYPDSEEARLLLESQVN